MNRYVRFFNADCYGRNVTFYTNGEVSAENVGFGEFSRYVPVADMSATFSMSCLNCNQGQCSRLEIDFNNSPVYTVAAVCISDEICLYGIREIYGEPNRSVANLRVCNLSPDIMGYDLYANRYNRVQDIFF